MAHTFMTPTHPSGVNYRTDADAVVKGLWGHFESHQEGIWVVLDGDTFREFDALYGDDMALYDRVYQGGRVYELTDQEALDLIEAGYEVGMSSGFSSGFSGGFG